MRLLFALFVIGVGIWLIVTAHDPTEMLTARVSASRIPLPSGADEVDFKFADGSDNGVVSPTAVGFYDAVTKFGPGPARVTRNEANDTIYEVEFHDETYTLDSPGTDLGGGIIAVVLGGLGLAWVVLSGRPRSFRAARDDAQSTVSGKARLERQLYSIADIIGSAPCDDIDRFWSEKVRACADLVRDGKPEGLSGFLGLFGGMGSINDQRFSHILRGELSSAYSLAGELSREHRHEDKPEVVLRPWSEGHAGRAVVYMDGTVITTVHDAPEDPNFSDLFDASGQVGNNQVAIMSIGPDGSCDVYRRNDRDEKWLAATLHAHHSMLHLVGLRPPQV